MKSIKQQYIDLKEGRMTQAQFMRNVRMSMPQYVTNITSFNDTVKILKNKGILTENQSEPYGADASKLSDTELKKKYKMYKKASSHPDFNEHGKKLLSKYEAEYKKRFTEKNINELGFTNEPVNSDEALLSIITKYISDPDEAQQELEAYRQKGYTGFSDPLIANLARDEEFQSWVQQGHDEETLEKEIGEAELNEDPVGQQAAGDPDEEAELKATLIKPEKINEIKNRISADKAHPHELRMGIRVEMEHTDDPKVAERIALDHLTENPFYYTMLKLSGADSNISEKSKAKEVKKKDETTLVDKKNGMKPVKGVEKPKKDADAKKETVKGQSVSLMSLIAKSVRGVKKMTPTGEKMKKVKLKEGQSIDWDNVSEKDAYALFDYHERTGRLPYDLTPEKYAEIMAKYGLKADDEENVDSLDENDLEQQGRELSKKIADLGLNKEKWDALSPNEKLYAVDRNRFIPSAMRLRAAKMSWEELKQNFQGLLQGFAFPTEPKKKEVDLGGSFDKFKDQLKEIIRKELKEMYDGRDNVTDVTGETELNEDKFDIFRDELINHKDELGSLYETGEEELDHDNLKMKIKEIIPNTDDFLIDNFLRDIAEISEENPEGDFNGWFDEYINASAEDELDENQEFTPENIKQMRDWLKDLTFDDVDDIEDLVDNLSDEEVIKAVDTHWDGGLEDFKSTL